MTVGDRGEVGKHGGHEWVGVGALASVAMMALTVVTVAVRPDGATAEIGRVPGGGVLRVSVPEAFGGKTVIGQLTVDQVVGAGFVTAFGCDNGLPTDEAGTISDPISTTTRRSRRSPRTG